MVQLTPTKCAICDANGDATELYPANFDEDAFNTAIFSARRLPDRLHYRMVKCRACGLVRSDPVADTEVLNQLYAGSTFDYGDLVADLTRTYGKYLDRLRPFQKKPGRLLEVGCGDGFFLKCAQAKGYAVRGVEPSVSAVQGAYPEVRGAIVNDVLRSGLFEDGTFDVICLFQVFDHIPDPGALLDVCFQLLTPGGLVLCLNHNVESVSARLLKVRSPIIDVEHTYLFSPSTLRAIFEKHGFVTQQVGMATNLYPLHYLVRLLPLPAAFKNSFLPKFSRWALGKVKTWVPLGNIYIVAQKENAGP